MQSEMSQTESKTPNDVSYMWNFKKKLINFKKIIDTENRQLVARGGREVEGGRNG